MNSPKMNTFDEQGREIPVRGKIAIPIGFHTPPSLQEQIRRFIRIEASNMAAAAGHETFEESDDFDVDDDVDFKSPHEMTELQEERALQPYTLEGGDKDGSDVKKDRSLDAVDTDSGSAGLEDPGAGGDDAGSDNSGGSKMASGQVRTVRPPSLKAGRKR